MDASQFIEIQRQAIVAALEQNDPHGVWKSQEPLTHAGAIEELVWRAKAEIITDDLCGDIPKGIACFQDLHDHVDANKYGLSDDVGTHYWRLVKATQDFDDGQDGEQSVQSFCDIYNAVQGALDEWLKAGRPEQPWVYQPHSGQDSASS